MHVITPPYLVVSDPYLTSYTQSLDAPTLQNISFNVKMGQLVAVIGPVGSGKVRHSFFAFYSTCPYCLCHVSLKYNNVSVFKSSLLSTILGELPHDKGIVKVTGNLTYASQQPWVYPGTIRSNILFGAELQPQRYERVLKACALKKVISFFFFLNCLEKYVLLCKHVVTHMCYHTPHTFTYVAGHGGTS